VFLASECYSLQSDSRLNFRSPYTRETYRYTPLLALLVTPNEWLHPSFGKYLFAACDIINGILIYKLLVSIILPRQSHSASKRSTSPESTVSANERQATIYSAIHLLNPMVFSISTRGSSESILSLFVLATLYAMLTRRWNVAAIALGISAHWKIYPFIYGFACLAALRNKGDELGTKATGRKSREVWNYLLSFLNRRILRFGVLSVATFGVLTGACYLMCVYLLPILHLYWEINQLHNADGATLSSSKHTCTTFTDETIGTTFLPTSISLTSPTHP